MNYSLNNAFHFSNATIGPKLPPFKKSNIVLGCVMSVLGNIIISISLNIQKYVHIRNSRLQVTVSYWKLPLWWLGINMMILGEVGNFVALGLAPASLIAPLATTTVISNMVIVVIFLKEKLHPEDIFGTTLALTGACMIVTFSSRNQYLMNSEYLTSLLVRTPFIIYLVIEIVLLIVLLVLHHRFNYNYLVILLGICAVFGSITVISAKGVSSLLSLTLKGKSQFKYPIIFIFFFLMVITGVLQVIYLNKSMKLYYSAVVVPTNFVFFTITAILAGTVYYREFVGHDSFEIFMFIFGCLLSCLGVYFIQMTKTSDDQVIDMKNDEISFASESDLETISDNSKETRLADARQRIWLQNQTVPTRVQILSTKDSNY